MRQNHRYWLVGKVSDFELALSFEDLELTIATTHAPLPGELSTTVHHPPVVEDCTILAD